MTRLDEPKGDGPSKEMYLSQKRSTDIRTLCIQILQNADRLLHDPQSQSKISSYLTVLHDLEKRLKALGINSSMHLGDEPETFLSDPVKAAEFVAGQVMNFLSRSRLSPESGVVDDIERISVDEKDDVSAVMGSSSHTIRAKAQSPAVLAFNIDGGMVNLLTFMLDAQDEVFPPNTNDNVSPKN